MSEDAKGWAVRILSVVAMLVYLLCTSCVLPVSPAMKWFVTCPDGTEYEAEAAYSDEGMLMVGIGDGGDKRWLILPGTCKAEQIK